MATGPFIGRGGFRKSGNRKRRQKRDNEKRGLRYLPKDTHPVVQRDQRVRYRKKREEEEESALKDQ